MSAATCTGEPLKGYLVGVLLGLQQSGYEFPSELTTSSLSSWLVFYYESYILLIQKTILVVSGDFLIFIVLIIFSFSSPRNIL